MSTAILPTYSNSQASSAIPDKPNSRRTEEASPTSRPPPFLISTAFFSFLLALPLMLSLTAVGWFAGRPLVKLALGWGILVCCSFGVWEAERATTVIEEREEMRSLIRPLAHFNLFNLLLFLLECTLQATLHTPSRIQPQTGAQTWWSGFSLLLMGMLAAGFSGTMLVQRREVEVVVYWWWVLGVVWACLIL